MLVTHRGQRGVERRLSVQAWRDDADRRDPRAPSEGLALAGPDRHADKQQPDLVETLGPQVAGARRPDENIGAWLPGSKPDLNDARRTLRHRAGKRPATDAHAIR